MRRIAVALLVVAMVCALGVGLWSYSATDYPEFNQSQASQPEVIVKTDRDYAYHIGDLVEVDIFVRQVPGSTVNVNSLSVEGDFELADDLDVNKKSLEDGSIVYHFPVKLQSFKVAEELKVTGNLSYQMDDKTNLLELSPHSIFTSRTWDGREDIMQGEDPSVSIIWIGLRFVAPLALASLVYLFLLHGAVVRWLRTPKPIDPHAVRRERFETVLNRVKESTSDSQSHLELDGLIRYNWAIGPIPADQLSESTVKNEAVIEFLQLNAIAVYSDTGLDQKQAERLVDLGNQIIQSW